MYRIPKAILSSLVYKNIYSVDLSLTLAEEGEREIIFILS
jgi:hypothetical protein